MSKFRREMLVQLVLLALTHVACLCIIGTVIARPTPCIVLDTCVAIIAAVGASLTAAGALDTYVAFKRIS